MVRSGCVGNRLNMNRGRAASLDEQWDAVARVQSNPAALFVASDDGVCGDQVAAAVLLIVENTNKRLTE